MKVAQGENQIGVVGAGLIGMSWAGLFSAFGYETTVYDPYLKKQDLAHREIDNIWGSLDLLFDDLKNKKEVKFSDGERFISIKPSTLSLDIAFELKYKNKIIGNQSNNVKVYEDDLTDIYNSRTYCLLEDIELIKKNGLAKGGSLQNAILVTDQEIINPEGFRNKKEFVNHKILDCIGDLYTSGYRIVASVTCSQGGHYLTNQLLRKLFQDKENFSIIEIKEKNLPHTLINRNLLKSIA